MPPSLSPLASRSVCCLLAENDRNAFEALGLGLQRDRLRPIRLRQDNRQAQTIEWDALSGLERLEACQVAVVRGDDLARAMPTKRRRPAGFVA